MLKSPFISLVTIPEWTASQREVVNYWSAERASIVARATAIENPKPITRTWRSIGAETRAAVILMRMGTTMPSIRWQSRGSLVVLRTPFVYAFRSVRLQDRPRLRKYSASSSRSQRSRDKIIFSGIQPTGVPHLGNYLGALKQWVKIQDEAADTTRLIFSVVDLHALTGTQHRDKLQRWRTETLAMLLAVGLNPKRSTIFFQSDVCEVHLNQILAHGRPGPSPR